MEKTDLTKALQNSISSEIGANATNLLEIGIDSLMDDGILKEIPVVSAVVGVYKIGHSIRELHYIKKLAAFVCALNNGTASEKEREFYRNALSENEKSRAREIEHILILLERYIHTDQAEMLARLYLAYLNESIGWNEFAKYSEVLNHFLPGDSEYFMSNRSTSDLRAERDDRVLRLLSLGLYYEETNARSFRMMYGKEVDASVFHMNKFGEKLHRILFPECYLTIAERAELHSAKEE